MRRYFSLGLMVAVLVVCCSLATSCATAPLLTLRGVFTDPWNGCQYIIFEKGESVAVVQRAYSCPVEEDYPEEGIGPI